MDVLFSPAADVAAVLNALLDRFELRQRRSPEAGTRTIKASLADLDLPGYFSQTDPEPRLAANRQFQELARLGLVKLTWQPGESGHLLEAVALPPAVGHDPLPGPESAPGHAALYRLLQRLPLADARAHLEDLLRADQFRFPTGEWPARALSRVLHQLRAGKSPAPFSLADPQWNLDLLAVLASLGDLSAETPYRVFSVRLFNDSKRFDELKPAVVRLARLANPAWKGLPAEELLREFNLVANPGYLPFAGNWQLTLQGGEVLALGGFAPAVGFPAAQAAEVQAVAVHAGAVLCIENLTAFHEFIRCSGRGERALVSAEGRDLSQAALVCILGNPSPPVRRILRLVPDQVPIYLWSDLDYGGFNILSQLRRQVGRRVLPHWMDVQTFQAHAHLARPLSQADQRNLKQLSRRPELEDVGPVINHLLHSRLKLEQEAIDIR